MAMTDRELNHTSTHCCCDVSPVQNHLEAAILKSPLTVKAEAFSLSGEAPLNIAKLAGP
jgi:hypothetical protein